MLKNSLHLSFVTPMITLNRIGSELPATIAVKLDYMSLTGSVKDRTAAAMVEDAQKTGKLIPGKSVIVEPTSGNMGIALARCAAVLGYKCIFCMPANVSLERRALVKAFGSEVILTDPAKGFAGMLERAEFLAGTIPGAVTLDQFSNPSNPEIHSRITAEEIWSQTSGVVDVVCFGVGTGGTLTGVTRTLKAYKPKIRAYAVEPCESAVLSGDQCGEHLIQGIGIGAVPVVLDQDMIDGVIRIKSKAAFEMTRRLAKEEGLFCGASSGANVLAAVELASRPENEETLIVTTINDFGERYLSTPLYATLFDEVSKLKLLTDDEALSLAAKYVHNNNK